MQQTIPQYSNPNHARLVYDYRCKYQLRSDQNHWQIRLTIRHDHLGGVGFNRGLFVCVARQEYSNANVRYKKLSLLCKRYCDSKLWKSHRKLTMYKHSAPRIDTDV